MARSLWDAQWSQFLQLHCFKNGAVSAGGALNTEDKKGKQDVDTMVTHPGGTWELQKAVQGSALLDSGVTTWEFFTRKSLKTENQTYTAYIYCCRGQSEVKA